MIEIAALTEGDRGRSVRYESRGGDKVEYGRIASWNDNFIFVRYHTQLKPEQRPRTGLQAEATSPEDLEFVPLMYRSPRPYA